MADSWADYFDKVHGEFPSSYANPWGLICYADEVHPGNQLAGTARKVWCVYMSFVQFGRHLSKSELWWTVMVKRSEDVSKLQASIGQLFRIILENIFGGNALGHPSNGLLLKRGDKTCRLFFKFQMWLQDGQAQKLTFSNKQDSGSRICQSCKNLFITRSADDAEENGDKELSKYIKKADLQMNSDKELVSSWRRMRDRQSTCNKGQFKSWQQAAGIDFSIYALLMSDSLDSQNMLRPVSGYVHDFMHGMLSIGVMGWVAYLVISTVCENGLPQIWERLADFLKLWVQPGFRSNQNVHRLFDSKHVANSRLQQGRSWSCVDHWPTTCKHAH